MDRKMLWGLLAVALAPALAWSGPGAKSPRLSLRATPRFALAAPVNVFLTAELLGGDEADDYYCPALDWEWGDGSRSVRESDCAPIETGAALERRFTAEHVYRGSGTYNIRVTLRRVSRSIAVANATVTVH